MRNIILLLLMVIAASAQAEVYKCQSANKQIVYQSTPCSANTVDQGTVEIEKQDARQQEEAQRQLKATAAERQVLDKAAKEQREAAAIEATRRDAAAARQDAAAARREAAKQSNTQYLVYIPYPAYHPYYNQIPAYNPAFSPYSSSNPNYPRSPYPPPYMTLPLPRR